MAYPPESCCYCPGVPGHAGGHAAPGSPGSPIAASTPRRRHHHGGHHHSGHHQGGHHQGGHHQGGHHHGGHHQGGHHGSIAEETLNEVADLESIGILRRSQMEIDIGHSAEHAVDELDFSRSLVLNAVPHEPRGARRGDQPIGHPIDQSYMSATGQDLNASCVCAPPQGSPDRSLGLMDPRHMARSMLDAGNELDFSGPDDLGPHPMNALRDLSSGIDDSFGIMPEGYMDRNMMGAPEFHTGGDEEVEHALETESQMTVYDPEDLNMTMAPRTNNIETRREVLYSTFTREYDDTEEEENEAVQEVLLDFHQRRRNEAARLSNE